MDSQFNSLVQSYSSNFVQYKVTGNQNYQTAFLAAKQGLDSIIESLKSQVKSDKQQISNFYKSGVEQKLVELDQTNRKLQKGLLTEKDDMTAAKMRSPQPSPPYQVSTSQYIMLGVLGAVLGGLVLL